MGPARLLVNAGHLEPRSRTWAERFPELEQQFAHIRRSNAPLPARVALDLRPEHVATAERLRANRVPTLFIAGELDDLVPVDVVRDAAALAGGAVAVIGAAGHSTYFEAPEDFNRAITEFEFQLPTAV